MVRYIDLVAVCVVAKKYSGSPKGSLEAYAGFPNQHFGARVQWQRKVVSLIIQKNMPILERN